MVKSTLARVPGLVVALALSTLFAQAPLSFGGPRIIRLDPDTHGVQAGDFDGDGLVDLAVVNNARARIELLLQRREPVPSPRDEEINVPVDDPLFERRHILTERQVGGFATADFDRDGRIDLAWYGDPRALVIAYQDEGGRFERRQEHRIRDGSMATQALTAGDFDGDGSPDLVLLAEREIVLLRGGEGGLGDPVRIPTVLEKLGYVRSGDVDGDGRTDLVMVDNNTAQPLRIRLQSANGGLGAEIAHDCPPVRSLLATEGSEGGSLLMVPVASGTLRRLDLAPEEITSGGLRLGNPRLHAFSGRGSTQRSVATGDIDGDGRIEVVVTDPEGARVLLYRQGANGELTGPTPYPAYRGGEAAAIADIDGDGKGEVLVQSSEERVVGALRWDGKRLGFPDAVVTAESPKVFAARDLDGDGAADIVAAISDKRKRELHIIYGNAAGAEPQKIELPSDLDPSKVLIGDLDGDGRAELVVLDRYAPPLIFKGLADRGFEPLEAEKLYAKTTLRNLTLSSTAILDLDGDGASELVYAAGNTLRAARLRDGALSVLDQVNAPAGSRVVAACAAELDGTGSAEVIIADKNQNSLRIMRRDASGVYTEAKVVDMGDFDFRDLIAVDLTGDGREDLLVAGARQLAVVPVGEERRVITHGTPYESPSRDAHLSWLAAADLTGSATEEIIVLDGRNNDVEILGQDGDRWKRLRSWKVFELKSFENVRPSLDEPHGLLVADVTGDGRKDIVILAHDRVLVYPREG
jgi:hypothetical protein